MRETHLAKIADGKGRQVMTQVDTLAMIFQVVASQSPQNTSLICYTRSCFLLNHSLKPFTCLPTYLPDDAITWR